MKLTNEQYQSASQTVGNISVAWFTVWIIAPILGRPNDIVNFVFIIVFGIIMSGLFFVISLNLAKEINND